MRSVNKTQPNDIDIASILSEAVERQNVAEKLYPACCNVTALHYLRTRGTQYVYKHEIALAVSAFDTETNIPGMKLMGNMQENVFALFHTLIPDKENFLHISYGGYLNNESGTRQMLMFDEARETVSAPGLIMLSDKTYVKPEEPLLSHIAYIEPLEQGGYTRLDATIFKSSPHYAFRHNNYELPMADNRIVYPQETVGSSIILTNASHYSDKLEKFWESLESKNQEISFNESTSDE